MAKRKIGASRKSSPAESRSRPSAKQVTPATGGYELKIGQRDTVGGLGNYSGGGAKFGTKCANCSMPLFSMFSLDVTGDERLRSLRLWPFPRLEVLVCPRCALYMEPYWIVYSETSAKVHGGERDGGLSLNNIEYPFRSQRRVTLSQCRLGQNAVHRIGGPDDGHGLDCICCGRPMRFGGVVGYDDENVPLYEDQHRPVALIIGDRDSLFWFVCGDCSAIGVSWVQVAQGRD